MNTDFKIAVEKQIDAGLVSKTKHPTKRLYLLNYTKKCQYDWIWNKITIQCRGLIVDKDYRIIQRPFRKFFSFDQYNSMKSKVGQLYKINLNKIDNKPHYSILDKPGNISIKYDGSLGILYWIKDKPFIATRGSFESEQAILGTQLIQKKTKEELDNFDRNFTYLFEIVSPDLRIVVEYSEPKLILIAIIDTSTGQDVCDVYGELDTTLDITLRSILESPQRKDIEGFCIHFPDLNDFRIKFKYDWYLELHKLLHQLTPRYIWEMYVDGTWKEKIPMLPDELQPDVNKQIRDWAERYNRITIQATKFFEKYKHYAEDISRRRFAIVIEQVVPKSYKKMLFKMLDKKSIHELILKTIKQEDRRK